MQSARFNKGEGLPDEESAQLANPIGSIDNLLASRRSYYGALIANERQIRSKMLRTTCFSRLRGNRIPFLFFLLSKVVQVIFYIHALSRMIHRFDNDPTDLEIDRDRSFRSSYSKIKDERCHRYIVLIEYYFFTFSDFCLTPS